MKEIDELIDKYEKDYLEHGELIEMYKKMTARWVEGGDYCSVSEGAIYLVRYREHFELLEKVIEDLKTIKEKR